MLYVKFGFNRDFEDDIPTLYSEGYMIVSAAASPDQGKNIDLVSVDYIVLDMIELMSGLLQFRKDMRSKLCTVETTYPVFTIALERRKNKKLEVRTSMKKEGVFLEEDVISVFRNALKAFYEREFSQIEWNSETPSDVGIKHEFSQLYSDLFMIK